MRPAVIRLLRFCARNRMLGPKYWRLAARYLARRLLTPAGRRWRTDGPVFFGRDLEIHIDRRGRVEFGRFVWIGDGSKIRCHEGVVEIGAKTVIGQECTVSAYQRVRIGEQCVIADRAMFIDFDHGVVEVERPIRQQGIYKRDVEVGSNVWIGYGACVLRGVRVGDNSIVGTNSVVTRDVPANAVVARHPGAGDPHARGPGAAALAAIRSSPTRTPRRRCRPLMTRASASRAATRAEGSGGVEPGARQLRVDSGRLLGDVGPVEAAQVLVGFAHQPPAELVVEQDPQGDVGERLGISRVEAQARLLVRDDLPQAAGVGDDAGAARGHRLERDEAEGLVDRRHHGQVGDPVERVQDVVADPAEEGAVLHQAQVVRLLAQLGLVGAGSGDQEARARRLLDHPRHRLEGELEALLVDEAADQQDEPLVGGRELGAQAAELVRVLSGRSSGSIPLGMTVTRSSSTPKMSAICSRM